METVVQDGISGNSCGSKKNQGCMAEPLLRERKQEKNDMPTYLNKKTNQMFRTPKRTNCVPEDCICIPDTCGKCAWKSEVKETEKNGRVLYWCSNNEVRVLGVWDGRKSCPKGVEDLRESKGSV